MVRDGFEPSTPRLSAACSADLSYPTGNGATGRIRTLDPLLTRQQLYQLSYVWRIGHLFASALRRARVRAATI